MRGRSVSSRDSYYTFSFSPFMLTLYKEDIVEFIKITKSYFPGIVYQIGGYSLEDEINNSEDLEILIKNDNFKKKEYHSFYFNVQEETGKEQPYLILDISPSSCNIYLSDSSSQKLKKMYTEIKKIIELRNIFRFFRKKIFNYIISICDIFFIIYMFFLKDIIEKAFNRRIPDIVLLLSVLLINIIFIIPHGKNKIYLFEKKNVNYLIRNRENLILTGALVTIIIFIVISVVNIMKI